MPWQQDSSGCRGTRRGAARPLVLGPDPGTIVVSEEHPTTFGPTFCAGVLASEVGHYFLSRHHLMHKTSSPTRPVSSSSTPRGCPREWLDGGAIRGPAMVSEPRQPSHRLPTAHRSPLSSVRSAVESVRDFRPRSTSSPRACRSPCHHPGARRACARSGPRRHRRADARGLSRCLRGGLAGSHRPGALLGGESNACSFAHTTRSSRPWRRCFRRRGSVSAGQGRIEAALREQPSMSPEHAACSMSAGLPSLSRQRWVQESRCLRPLGA